MGTVDQLRKSRQSGGKIMLNTRTSMLAALAAASAPFGLRHQFGEARAGPRR
jgi:hypothetical protein